MKPSNEAKMIAEKPGKVQVFSADGELLYALPVPLGISPFSAIAAMVPSDAELRLDGVVILEPPERFGSVAHDQRLDIGAVQDFQPASIDRLERAESMVRRLASMNMSLIKREAAAKRAMDPPEPRLLVPEADVKDAVIE